MTLNADIAVISADSGSKISAQRCPRRPSLIHIRANSPLQLATMSSLAQQLQGIASIDSSRLTSRTGAPQSKSYLFTPTEAAQQDLDEVYQIGLEGFAELVELDPAMMDFEEELFSEVSKRTDRMMLTQQENKELDEVLGRCLRRLGRWIGVMACGRCLEWLVRRFRWVVDCLHMRHINL